jgi:hypothetical protein
MSEIPERFAGIRMRRVQPAQEAEVEQNTENPRFPGIRMRQVKSAEPAAEVEPEVEQDTNPRFPGIRMREIKPAEPAAEETEPKVEQESPVELPKRLAYV